MCVCFFARKLYLYRSRILLTTDSTIAPPQEKQRYYLANVSRLLGPRKDAMNKIPSHVFLFAKDYRTLTSGWRGGTVFRKIRSGAGFKTGKFR